MNRLLAIARREWAGYFRTPAGWAVLALFLLLQGIVFWMFVQFLGRPDAPPGGVMEFFFGGTILYWIALGLLATVVPMRLIAEELRTGTIEPLLTAPVSPGEVVVGKWLAALGFYLAAWAPTLLYLVYLRRVGAALEPGPIVAGLPGDGASRRRGAGDWSAGLGADAESAGGGDALLRRISRRAPGRRARGCGARRQASRPCCGATACFA